MNNRVVLAVVAASVFPIVSLAQAPQNGLRIFPTTTIPVASDPSAGFANDKNIHKGTRPLADPAQGDLGPAGGMNPLPQHGNINGGMDHGYTRMDMIFGARLYTGNFTDAIEFAWYTPSQPDKRYRVGDQRFTTGRIGGNGGTDRGWYYCPNGYVAVGLQGGSGTAAVDRLGLICGELGAPSKTVTLPVFGGNGGSVFSDNCGQIRSTGLMTGIRVRSGDWMDSVQGLCQEAGN
jgi:hypothetical protein